MRRWTPWVAGLIVVALVAVRVPAQDKAQDKKDAVNKPDEKKPDEKKPDVKKPDEKKPDEKKPEEKKPDEKKPDVKKPDEKKPDVKKPEVKMPAPAIPDRKEAEKKLVKTGTILGELVHIEPGKQAIRVKVSYQYSELNQGAVNALLQAQAQYQQALAKRDWGGARSAQQSMVQQQLNLYQVKTTSQEYAIEAASEMKVRLPRPKSSFDETGNIKVLNAKETAKLRGKDSMFDGEFSDLNTGSIVQVTLILPKVATKPKNKDDLDVREEAKLEATKIAVLKEPIPEAPPGGLVPPPRKK